MQRFFETHRENAVSATFYQEWPAQYKKGMPLNAPPLFCPRRSTHYAAITACSKVIYDAATPKHYLLPRHLLPWPKLRHQT